MTKIILSGFLLLSLPFIGLPQKGYTINGSIPTSLNGKQIYLYGIDYSKMNNSLLDSSIITNGQFAFKGSINTPAMMVSIYLKDSRKFLNQFFVENKEMDVKVILLDSTHPRTDVVVSNSPVTEQHKLWRQYTDSLSSALGKSYYVRDSLQAAGAPDSALTAIKESQDKLKSQLNEIKVNFIKQHSDDYISLYWLRYDLAERLSSEMPLLQALYKSLSPKLKALPEGEALSETIKTINNIQVGKIAPPLSEMDSSGNVVKLSDFRGKYLLIDFWASWCGPCIETFPTLKTLYQTYHRAGMEILSISLDDNRKRWLDAMNKYQLSWANTSELKGWEANVAKQYNIKAIPKTILLDKEGKIIAIDGDLSKQLAAVFQ